MNHLDLELGSYDYAWSACAIEHLGSIQHGINFIRRHMACLRLGGIAVHTMEYNLTSDSVTVETKNLSLFRKRDILEMIAILRSDGCLVEEFDPSPGALPADEYVDQPPYRGDPAHLKLAISSFVCTSAGLIIQKGD